VHTNERTMWLMIRCNYTLVNQNNVGGYYRLIISFRGISRNRVVIVQHSAMAYSLSISSQIRKFHVAPKEGSSVHCPIPARIYAVCEL